MRPSDEHWCGRPPSPPSHPRPPTPRLMWQSRSSRSGGCVDRRHPCWWWVGVWRWLPAGACGVVSAFRRSVGVSSSGCSRVGLGRACAQGARAPSPSSGHPGVVASTFRWSALSVCGAGCGSPPERKKERKKERKGLGAPAGPRIRRVEPSAKFAPLGPWR